MRSPFVAALALAIGALLFGGPADAGADLPPAEFRYIRDQVSIGGAARRLVSEAVHRRCDTVVFVFDLAAFDPPPGRSEWADYHAWRDDLPQWFAAIDSAAAEGKTAVLAASTHSAKPVPAAGGWAASIRADLSVPWWDDDSFSDFDPAERWARRLLAAAPGKRKALVYIGSEFVPENRTRLGDAPWRTKLADFGEGFDAERVGDAVAAGGDVLLVCAPETRFGDDLMLQDLPDFPWAARPRAEPAPLVAGVPITGGDIPGLRDLIRDQMSAGRFAGMTPTWHRSLLGVPFHSDSPSGYGWWPYARAAARTGGAYVFYPFPPSRWLDVCPRDDALVDACAPSLEPLAAQARGATEDVVIRGLARAQAAVFAETPWADPASFANVPGDGRARLPRGLASSWFAFETGGRRADRWFPREKPVDRIHQFDSVEAAHATAKRLLTSVAAYDEALGIVAATADEIRDGAASGVSRRARANLRLARFHLEMSAFHLEAAAIYLAEIERHMPEKRPERFVLTYVPTIRLSDCLDAYDGQTIDPDEEARWARPRWEDLPDPPGFAERGIIFNRRTTYQDNLLSIPKADPDYRARRDLDAVLLRLDPRLIRRALRMVVAAEDVMRHDARSGWGWVTYYSDADTFVWQEVPDWDGDGKRPPIPPVTDEPPKGPTTPRGGGSSGGGSTTPR